MIQMLLIIKNILDILVPIIILYVSLSYSRKAREKYKILKFSDGKQHIILIIVALIFIFNRVIEHRTGTNPETKEDVKEIVQQSNDEQWDKAFSELKKAKWSLEGTWNLDNFGLIEQKILILLLADQVMWYKPNGGNYASYQKLWSLRRQNNFPQSFVEDQLQRVNSVLHLANAIVKKIPLCKHGKNIGNKCLEVEEEDDFDVNNVVAQLSHPKYWVSRAKSAYLLHFLTPEMIKKTGISWGTILDALCTVFSGANEIHKNNNLLVRYMAWESFRKHTCFADEKELFDVQKASTWWKDEGNRQKVLNALENGQKSPFCRN